MREVHAIWRGPFRAYFHRRFTRAYSVNKKSRTVHAFFMQTIEEIHIGEIIKHVMKEQGRSPSWLAKQLGCERANVYDIYKRQYIDTHLLQKVSIILNHDFFQVYSFHLKIVK